MAYYKRMKYVSTEHNESSSSEGDSCEEYTPTTHSQSSESRRGRKRKSFSKNALQARENRLKKKLYLSTLEREVETLRNDNKKLTAVLDNQSQLLTQFRNENKYLKSVIANSSDIGRLIRSINHSSGMSVSSSLDESLSLKNVYIPKQKQSISRKTAHPWEETVREQSENNLSPDQGLCDDFDAELFEYLRNEDLFDTAQLDKVLPAEPLEEHNYTSRESCDDEDVGVCLHVSRKHVSLEFCASCSDKAQQARV